ncbi:MAG: hypothetical protein H7838_11560 [Magnetococcus sp. DMHC-8]
MQHPATQSPVPLFSPDQIKRLERLKNELAFLQSALENLQDKSPYEVEGRIRQFQDKEAEIHQFLRDMGMA